MVLRGRGMFRRQSRNVGGYFRFFNALGGRNRTEQRARVVGHTESALILLWVGFLRGGDPELGSPSPSGRSPSWA